MSKKNGLGPVLALSSSDAAKLAHAVWDATGVEYGMPFAEAIEQQTPGRDWLGSAVLAGYAPPYFDSVYPLMCAHDLLTRSHVDEHLGKEDVAAAQGFARDFALSCRELAGWLEQVAIEWDTIASKVGKDSPGTGDPS